MRSTKLAIAAAFAASPAVSNLVPRSQVFAVERATVPTLPAIEIIAIGSERVDGGPMIKHELSCEITVANATEDGADVALDGIARAVRRRLLDAEVSMVPIVLPDGGVVVVTLQGTRWSVSASGATGVIRGASISLSVVASE